METQRGEVPVPADHHRDIKGGSARAAVFGVSDGLVTNVSLILGVAGAQTASSFVRLAGLAGLISGAFSMAAGEYISMRAQSELLERELDQERRELHRNPIAERRELIRIYEGRGVPSDTATELAEVMMRDPQIALETHAREELGVDPNALGSPWAAAGASFVAFSIGALVPLLPWYLTTASLAFWYAIAASAVAALIIGAVLAVFTGRSRVRSALRQLLVAAVAAGVTFGIGRIIGASSSG